MELSFLKRFHRLFAVNAVIPAVPHHHRASAILALRDNSFEVFIFDRMIFHFHCEMFFTSFPRQPFRQRPRFQHALHLEAEIVMQTARSVFLNDKTRRALDFRRQRLASCWLNGLLEVAFPLVFFERHSSVQPSHGQGVCTRVVQVFVPSTYSEVRRSPLQTSTLRLAAARRQDSGQTGGR